MQWAGGETGERTRDQEQGQIALAPAAPEERALEHHERPSPAWSMDDLDPRARLGSGMRQKWDCWNETSGCYLIRFKTRQCSERGSWPGRSSAVTVDRERRLSHESDAMWMGAESNTESTLIINMMNGWIVKDIHWDIHSKDSGMYCKQGIRLSPAHRALYLR